MSGGFIKCLNSVDKEDIDNENVRNKIGENDLKKLEFLIAKFAELAKRGDINK